MDTPSTPTTETITVQGQAPAAKSHLWAGDHFSFHDLLDAINPLQHIPIVSTIYRAVTGDTLGNAARVVGDGLYGGVIGVIAGLVDVSVIEATGKDIGGNVMAVLDGDGDKPAGSETAEAAQAATPAEPPAAPAAPTAAAASPAKPAAGPAPQAHGPVSIPAAWAGLPLKPTPASTAPQPLAAEPKLMSLDGKTRGFAIDTSPEGILALRTTSNSAPRPVPLNVPGGTMAPIRRIPVTGAEFAQRMQEGLDKYKALMVERNAATADTGGAVDQLQ
jgi:hypothetical protein